MSFGGRVRILAVVDAVEGRAACFRWASERMGGMERRECDPTWRAQQQGHTGMRQPQ